MTLSPQTHTLCCGTADNTIPSRQRTTRPRTGSRSGSSSCSRRLKRASRSHASELFVGVYSFASLGSFSTLSAVLTREMFGFHWCWRWSTAYMVWHLFFTMFIGFRIIATTVPGSIISIIIHFRSTLMYHHLHFLTRTLEQDDHFAIHRYTGVDALCYTYHE